jgi:hypothetical protein
VAAELSCVAGALLRTCATLTAGFTAVVSLACWYGEDTAAPTGAGATGATGPVIRTGTGSLDAISRGLGLFHNPDESVYPPSAPTDNTTSTAPISLGVLLVSISAVALPRRSSIGHSLCFFGLCQ